LSTAVLMMITAGVLIWANAGKQRETVGPGGTPWFFQAYGWPKEVGWTLTIMDEPIKKMRSMPIEWGNGAIDLAVTLSILSAVWFLCEWWIRRRAARKGTLGK